MREIAKRFLEDQNFTKEEFEELLKGFENKEERAAFQEKAAFLREKYYGNKVFTRGLIEFTNYCKNNCYYCGIRGGNKNAVRYRLTKEEILSCCKEGYDLGFRTFVLQGGEDPWFTDERMVEIIREIKGNYLDCALTLSIGEKSYESYKKFREAGADRYLLRHETADEIHYGKLHPSSMRLSDRKKCLFMLKELGYQTGAGFMVGSPGQTPETLAEDFLFLKELNPEMVGIGPFIAHKDTPFGDRQNGSMEDTLFYLALIRLLLPNSLLPATTALGTIHPKGRELGILSGANVVMPNLSPPSVRKKYMLYNGKLSDGDEAAECVDHLKKRMEAIGCKIVTDRGDYKKERKKYV